MKVLKILPFFFIILLSIYVFKYTNPTEIISYVGIQNAYILMFVFACFAGISSFNAAPYYFMLFFLANAGFEPVILGFVSAMGIMSGDAFVYFMGKEGKDLLPAKITKQIEIFSVLAKKYPKLFLTFSFSYGCISPFSNNFITAASGIAEIPFYKLMIPLGMGNIIYNISIVYLAIYANDFITQFIG